MYKNHILIAFLFIFVVLNQRYIAIYSVSKFGVKLLLGMGICLFHNIKCLYFYEHDYNYYIICCQCLLKGNNTKSVYVETGNNQHSPSHYCHMLLKQIYNYMLRVFFIK